MTPFLGLEKTDPYSRLRVGRISKIRDSVLDLREGQGPEKYLGTAEIEWIDWGGVAQAEVPLTYSSFSNPVVNPTNQLLQETPGSPIVGSSHGFLYMPSVGDIVACGFRYDGRPIIVGFLAQNYYQQTQSTPKTNSGFGTFRRLVSGEYSWKSQQQAEVYLDRKGAFRIVVRSQPASTTSVPTVELATLTLGTTYDTTSFTTPETSTQGSNTVARLKVKNTSGTVVGDISIDAVGNISLTSAGGAVLTLTQDGSISLTPASGKNVTINGGTKGAARLQDEVSIDSSLATLLSLVLTHTHPGVLAGGASTAPSATLVSQTVPTNSGQIAQASDHVLIG